MITFSVLGSLMLRSSGADVDLPGALPGRTLALLLARAGRPLPVEVIADQLWHGAPPRTARKSIQVIIHRLRRMTGLRDRLVLSESGYLLRLAESECDALAFESAIARATRLYEDGDLPAAELLFARALDMWRGPPFAGVDDVPMVRDESQRLTGLRLAAWENHADTALRLGRHYGVIAELARMVAANPFRERLRGQLMLALYRSGRVAEALQEYRSARASIAEELGVEPGSGLQDLHCQMLNRDPRLLLSAAALVREHSFLPRSTPGFTGRRSELDWLDDRARDVSSTAVISSVSGVGGVGKTALMLHWAYLRTDQFPDGQLFVNLGGGEHGLTTPKGALHHLLTCLGVPKPELPVSLEDTAAQYRALLAGRKVLVLLDDARTADQVRPLLPGAPDCFVIVTSRTSLGGLVACDGARQFHLRPLPPGDAMALLRQLLGEARVDGEPEATQRLAEVCGGMPLALRIAAANLSERPDTRVAAYVAELEALGPIAALVVDGDEHHGVKAVFDASYEMLSPAHRAAFRMCGAIPGPDLTRDSVAAGAGITIGEADAALTVLVGTHFVEESRPGRYAMHDLVRGYSREMLQASGTPESEPLDRLLHHYRHVANTALALVRPGLLSTAPVNDHERNSDAAVPSTPAAAAAWLGSEYENLAAAISSAAAQGMADHVQALVDPLWQLCHHYGQTSQWISTFEAVIDAMRRHGAGDAIYPVLNALGNAYVMAGQSEAAIDAHSRCAQAWADAGRTVDAARARTNLAASMERLARYPDALAELARALETFRQADLPSYQAYVLGLMGSVRQRLRDFTGAHACLTEALELLRPTGRNTDLARTLNMLANVCLDLRRIPEASEFVEAAVDVARESGNAHLETMAQTTRASILRALGRYEESLTLSRKAHQAICAMNMPGNECESQLEMGLTYALSGRPEEALEAYRQAQAIAKNLGEVHLRVRALLGLGSCLREIDPDGAVEHLRAALTLMEDLELPEVEDARRVLATL
jgi:DNA-binding SARP family transcriptional activator